ncbi:Ger(x)C family spore germination protein [Paenibacillus sedimenti]|uniref:Ger(X)C family spore germination protein n=1 Tax=Paenibacillus sedimenti TaxID=2770274 RepID=A0A926KU44_9BACL|nr:Ger(x)C family spore germination protein [Paenibacillus sedimenti]MBD0382926.1 Ger(x)C family spore germination protein [Paenibacillus sedimenti]
MRATKFSSIFLLLCLSLLLAGCWNSRELSDMGIVVGMGIDKMPETNQYRVSFQIVNPGAISMGSRSGGGRGAMPVTVYSDTGHTVFSALRKTSQKVSRQLFFAHIQLIVISESLAKEGIQDLFDVIERSHEFRLNSPIIISRETDAESVLKMILPLESTTAKGISKRMEITTRVWAQTVNAEVKDVIKALSGPGEPAISGVLITEDPKIGGSKSNLEKTKLPSYLVIRGVALFEQGKLVHWLDGDKARGVLWILNKMKSTVVNIPCEDKKEGTSIELIRSNTQIKVRMENDNPVFHIAIREEGNVTEVHCPVDLSKREEIVKLQNQWADETKKEVMESIKAAQSKKIDIFGFGDAVKRTYPKGWSKMEKDWPTMFAESKIEVQVQAYVRRTGMRTKPYLKKEQSAH